jgi:hypothetical protein
MILGNPGTTLLDAARLTKDLSGYPAPYPTPQSHDAKVPKTPEQIEAMRTRSPKRSSGGPPGISNLNEVVLQMRPAEHMTSTVKRMEAHAVPASWATPVSTELGNTIENYCAMKRNMKSGPRQAITHPSLQAQLTAPAIESALPTILPGEEPSADTGPSTSSGSGVDRRRGAKTGASGQLHPALPSWLMGLPPRWLELAPRD